VSCAAILELVAGGFTMVLQSDAVGIFNYDMASVLPWKAPSRLFSIIIFAL
jgi:hypothetical protein